MAFDIAVNGTTGDFIPGPNGDYLGVVGVQQIRQRIITRLRLKRGGWILDPSKQLGSRLYDLMRLPLGRAIIESEAAIREALSTMPDIDVRDVSVYQDPQSPSGMGVNISFQLLVGSQDIASVQLQIPRA